MELVAAGFSDTITLGSILLGLFIGIPALWVYFKGLRWKSEADMRSVTITTLRESNDSLIERSRELGTEKDELQQQIARLETECESLRARPDWNQVVAMFERGLAQIDEAAHARQTEVLTKIFAALHDHDDRVNGRYEEVERRAQARHEAEMEVSRQLLEVLRRKQ